MGKNGQTFSARVEGVLVEHGFWKATSRGSTFLRQRPFGVDCVNFVPDRGGESFQIWTGVWIPDFAEPEKVVKTVDDLQFRLWGYIAPFDVIFQTGRSWPVDQSQDESAVECIELVVLPWLDAMKDHDDVTRVLEITGLNGGASAANRSRRLVKTPPILFPEKLHRPESSPWRFYALPEVLEPELSALLAANDFAASPYLDRWGAESVERGRVAHFLRIVSDEVSQHIFFSNDGSGQGVSVELCVRPFLRANSKELTVEFIRETSLSSRYLGANELCPANSYHCFPLRSNKDVDDFKALVLRSWRFFEEFFLDKRTLGDLERLDDQLNPSDPELDAIAERFLNP